MTSGELQAAAATASHAATKWAPVVFANGIGFIRMTAEYENFTDKASTLRRRSLHLHVPNDEVARLVENPNRDQMVARADERGRVEIESFYRFVEDAVGR